MESLASHPCKKSCLVHAISSQLCPKLKLATFESTNQYLQAPCDRLKGVWALSRTAFPESDISLFYEIPNWQIKTSIQHIKKNIMGNI
jgi:hypothetical protein